jgi:hypothetical protein
VKIIKFIGEKKNKDVITLKIRTFEYSAIKIKANSPAPYSTLNPETSSASPSGRSNGARLVSAKIEIIQGRNIGSKTIKNIDFILENSTKENEFANKHKEIIIKIILTS